MVRVRERGTQHIVIEVVDHGLGIPPEQVGKLFQKFARVRTEDHLKVSGTGLGLYISRLIVEGHGGQIWVESELGKGSTFGLALPVDARTAQRAPATSGDRADSPDTAPHFPASVENKPGSERSDELGSRRTTTTRVRVLGTEPSGG